MKTHDKINFWTFDTFVGNRLLHFDAGLPAQTSLGLRIYLPTERFYKPCQHNSCLFRYFILRVLSRKQLKLNG